MNIDAPDPPILVSIITPTLNQAGFLANALESVARQSYAAIEHIVVDGGSTDGTLELLRTWESGAERRWSSDPDRGMYQAINRGLQSVRGEIVGYLNSDDVLLPWAIDTVVREFRMRPTLDIVYGDALRLAEPEGSLLLALQVPFRYPRLARFGSLVQPSVFWRRAVHERLGGFDSDLSYGGDLDFWLRAAVSSSVGQLEEVLSIYRVHPAALTSRMRRPMRAEERSIRARHHRDGRYARFRQMLARVSHAAAVRRQQFRFARAARDDADPRWQEFRSLFRPRVRPAKLAVAMLPLLTRWIDIQWVEMRDPEAAGVLGATHP